MIESRPDVVVIGAGLAGLMSAVTLQERNLSVEVIDASEGVGGRIRTDVVDGHRCDRGFQLINPSYPAVKRYLDIDALQLGTFDAGVAVAGPSGIRVVADPIRGVRLLAKTVASGYGRPLELARLARWAAPALGRVPRLLAGKDTDLTTSLDRGRVTGHLRAEILEPFLAGVLADSSGRTSATFVRLLLRSFLLGTPGVPAGGMVAVPEQLAAKLVGPVHLGVRATRIATSADGPVVDTSQGQIRPRVVVVATDPSSAAALLPITAPKMNGLVTYWFSVTQAPTDLKLLFVDGGFPATGPVVNTAVMSHAAPSYAPPGRHLVQATTLHAGQTSEQDVRRHLSRMYKVPTSGWELLIRHDVPEALPAQLPPLRHRQPVELGDGVFVAGDHRDTASIQGALVSGRRAANAVRAYLGA